MKMLSIAAIAVVFTGLNWAAEELAVKPIPTGTKAEQDGAPVGTAVQTAGKIASMHVCPMVGVSDPHMIVKIDTAEGDTDIVDLGSVAELKTSGIEPKQGQQLWVDGRVGKINDKFLIVAERLSESKLIMITRTTPLREETVKHAEARSDSKEITPSTEVKAPKVVTVDPGQQVRTVEGSVIHTRHVKIEGETNDHMLAKVQTENGIVVLDLGNCDALPANVNLLAGQSLAATGFVGQLNGKPIILANSMGNLNTISRPVDAPVTPAGTPPAPPVK